MIVCLSVYVFSLSKKLTRQEDQKLFLTLFDLIIKNEYVTMTVLEIDAYKNMSTSLVSNSLSLEYNRSGAAPVFNFSSCASVVINNYRQKLQLYVICNHCIIKIHIISYLSDI